MTDSDSHQKSQKEDGLSTVFSGPLDKHHSTYSCSTSHDYRKAVLVKKRVVNTYSRAFPRQVFDKHHFLTPDTPVVEELELPSHLFRESGVESTFNSLLKASSRLGDEPDSNAATKTADDGKDKENVCLHNDAVVPVISPVQVGPGHKQAMRLSSNEDDHEDECQGSPTKLQKLRLHQQKKTGMPQRVQAGGKKGRRGGKKGSKATKKCRKRRVANENCAVEFEVGDKIIPNELDVTQLQKNPRDLDEAISCSTPAKKIQLASALPSEDNHDNFGIHSTDSPGFLGDPNNLDTVSMEMTCETTAGAYHNQRPSRAGWEDRTLKLSTQVLVIASLQLTLQVLFLPYM